MDLSQQASANRVLHSLPAVLRDSVLRVGRTTMLIPGESLETDGSDSLFFPCSGILSIRVQTDGDAGLEVAMVGREGVVGYHALPGSGSALRVVAMTSGEALRLDTSDLAEGVRADLLGSGPLLRCQQVMAVQMAYAVLAGVRRTVAERLARWLLMSFDRLEQDVLITTHDALSAALGVRRPGITVATHELEGVGAIRAKRGVIRLLDRERLVAASRQCYGGAEHEDALLFGRTTVAQDGSASARLAPSGRASPTPVSAFSRP